MRASLIGFPHSELTAIASSSARSASLWEALRRIAERSARVSSRIAGAAFIAAATAASTCSAAARNTVPTSVPSYGNRTDWGVAVLTAWPPMCIGYSIDFIIPMHRSETAGYWVSCNALHLADRYCQRLT